MPRFGCDEASGLPRPLWYAFARRRVLFLAVSAAHPLSSSSEQHAALSRAARGVRAGGGISWVVAFGERPANASAGSQLQRALGSLGADLYVCAPPAWVGEVAAVGAEGFYAPAKGKKGVAVLGLGRGGYARVLAANRSALVVEHVHAADGAVLASFGVGATTRKLVGK